MKEFKYTIEQLNKINSFLNQIEVKGQNSITALAMVFQEISNGIEVTEEEERED